MFKFKKNLILAPIMIIGCVITSFAQVDLKIGPLGPVFGTLNLRSEFALSNKIGIEASIGTGWNRVRRMDEPELRNQLMRLGLNGRFYFNPTDRGQDKFYMGIYSRYAQGNTETSDEDNEDSYETERFSIGLLAGSKTFFGKGRFLFEYNFGLGRNLVYTFDAIDDSEPFDLSTLPLANLDVFLSLMIGYRFGGKK
jgi:Protein of unknown function (DUF3575)